MEIPMPKRITIRLDDDVYEELLRRAGSERKISETLNPIIRIGLQSPPSPEILARIGELRVELTRLEAQVTGQRPAEDLSSAL
jgi:hypothetical protein